MKSLMCWLVCLATITACAATKPSPLDGTTWQLQQIDDTAVPAEVHATIAFTAGQFMGNGGCNQYGGTYTVNNADISFTLGQMTMMACMGPGGDTEQHYLPILATMTHMATRDTQNGATQLVLHDTAKHTRLVFVQVIP